MLSLVKLAALAAVVAALPQEKQEVATPIAIKATPVFATPIRATYSMAPLPSGALTQPFNARIHPQGNTNKCLDVREHKFENGTPVQVWDCGSGAPDNQVWWLNGGRTTIRVAGTNYCLDVGNEPLNDGTGLKIWRCHGGPQQQFDYGRDGRIRVPGKNICIDLTDGKSDNGNQLQIYGCGDAQNDNQYMPSREVGW